MSQTERVCKIEMLIRHRGRVSFAAMLEELEVSPATLKRDLELLRSRLGAPIVHDRDSNGYGFDGDYRSQRHEWPGLWFNQRELYSLLMAHQLLSELDSDGMLSRHLQPLLGPRRAGVQRAGRRRHVEPSPAAVAGPHPPDAGRARRAVQGADEARTHHRIGEAGSFQPFLRIGRRSLDRASALALPGTRSRRCGRARRSASAPGPLPRHLVPRRLVPPCRGLAPLCSGCHRGGCAGAPPRARDVAMEQVEAEMDAGYGIHAGGVRQWATLVFDAQAAQWVSREAWHPEQHSRWLDDGRYELGLPFVGSTGLAMDILRHGDEGVVQQPAELRAAVRARLLAAAQNHEPVSSAGPNAAPKAFAAR